MATKSTEVKPKAVKQKAPRTTKRKTVDTDDLTVVYQETLFGGAAKYKLVRHYGTLTGEQDLMKSDNSFDKTQVLADALELSKKLNIPLYQIK